LLMVRLDEPVPPSRLQRGVPRDLETVCLHCLEKNAARRYRSAANLADELGRFRRGEPVAARPVGAVGRRRRWGRRNPVVASLMVTVAATLLLGATAATYFALQARSEAGEKERQRRQAVTQKEEADKQRAEAETQRRFAQQESQRAGKEAAENE